MEYLWKKTAAVLLLGSVLALAGCDLGDENGSTESASSTPPPTTPLSYSSNGSTSAANLQSSNQGTAGTSATSSTGGLINNAANGGLNNIIGPISVVADSGARASNATIVGLFSSLNLASLNQPASVLSQNFENPAPCVTPSPDSAITYYLADSIYIVVKFNDACLAVLSGTSPNNEATVNGQVVVFVSEDTKHYTFTPYNLTVTDNATMTVYNVPTGTYELDNSVSPAALTILVPCPTTSRVCKITAPSDLSTASPYSFTDAKVYDPELGMFNVKGDNLVVCVQGSGGTADSPFQGGGSLTLTTDPASVTVRVDFNGCGAEPDINLFPE